MKKNTQLICAAFAGSLMLAGCGHNNSSSPQANSDAGKANPLYGIWKVDLTPGSDKPPLEMKFTESSMIAGLKVANMWEASRVRYEINGSEVKVYRDNPKDPGTVFSVIDNDHISDKKDGMSLTRLKDADHDIPETVTPDSITESKIRLHQAVTNCSPRFVKSVANPYFDSSVLTKELDTAIWIPGCDSEAERAAMVGILIDSGANPNGKNKDGKPFLAVAKEMKQAKVVKALEDHGAK